MANDYFSFRQFTIRQERAAFKVGTDGVLLGACADFSGAGKILDIGTGTGLIAIMAAQRSDGEITAIEPDEESFRQAVDNVNSCPWRDRIRVIKTDLADFFRNADSKFNTVITNPPYFRDSLTCPDPAKSAARHSFSLSHNDLLLAASGLLTEKGSLQLILPFEEGTLLIAEASEYGLYCNSIIKIKPDPGGKVIRMIMKFEAEKKTVHEKFLTIETGTRHRYTDEYQELTREFYLGY